MSSIPAFPEFSYSSPKSDTSKKTKDIQAVVDRYDDGIAVMRHIPAFVSLLFDCRAKPVTAAVEPDHDRSYSVIAGRRPDIEVHAVFVLRPVAVRAEKLADRLVNGKKRADEPVIGGVKYSVQDSRLRPVEPFGVCIGMP